MKKTTKLVLMSVLVIALCVSLIVGATFALFTDEQDANIDVTTGTVDIKATASLSDAWSALWDATKGEYIRDPAVSASDNEATFAAHGFASYAGGTLTLDRMVAGDGVALSIAISNYSNVWIKYRVVVAIEDNGLVEGLTISYTKDGSALQFSEAEGYLYSEWVDVEEFGNVKDGKALGTIGVTVELPTSAGTQYEGKSCKISVKVEAVQINGHITDTEKLTEKDVVLNSELLDGVVDTGITSKSLVVGSWSTYADVVGGDFKDGALVANNNNVRAFEVGDKVYVLVYGTLVADTDYDDQDGLFCQYDFEEVDLSDVDFSTLTANTLGYMFEGSSLKVINLSGADLSKLTSMNYLFAFCSQLEEVYFKGAILKNLPASDESAMSYVFHGCTALKKVDFSDADLTNVGKISSMFWSGYRTSTSVNVDGNGGSFSSSGTPTYACTNLEEVIFADATFENVTAILYDIFKGATSLKHVDFSNCDLHNLTTINWFGHQTKSSVYTPALQTIDLSGANLSGVTSLQYAFRYCSELETVNLTNTNLSSVTSLNYAFGDCTKLTNVILTNTILSSASNLSYALQNCKALVKADFTQTILATSINIDYLFSGCSALEEITFNGAKAKDVSGNDLRVNFTGMSQAFNACNVLTTLDFSGCDFALDPTSAFSSAIKASLETLSFANCKFSVSTLSYLSNQFSNLKYLYFTGANLSNFTSLPSLANTKTLLEVDYSNADISGMTTWTSSTFSGCTALTKVDFSEAKFDGLTSISAKIFSNCASLKLVDFSGINFLKLEKLSTGSTSNATFDGCANLETIDFSNSKFPVLQTWKYAFYNCTGLKTVDFTNVDFSEVTDMSYMFQNCTSLESIDLSSLDLSNVTTVASMFRDCTSLKDVKFGSDLHSVTTTTYMFSGCKGLEKIDLSNIDLSKATTVSYMFKDCENLETIDFSNAKLQTWKYAFSNCTGLKTVYFTNTDFSEVTDMSYMFYGCTSLESIDLSNLDLSNVTIVSYMFQNCTSLESIDLSKTDFSGVTTTSYMFDGCTALKSVDLWSELNITSASYMFRNCEQLEHIYVTGEVDLSGITGSNMFTGCDALMERAQITTTTKAAAKTGDGGYFENR